mmetsp:Transcript_48013/g.150838  ORF Transcript_48013/g.150838 Transcript_48013/m.150838 type:complete len:248 (+) Transcript_48013:504-1247(+)
MVPQQRNLDGELRRAGGSGVCGGRRRAYRRRKQGDERAERQGGGRGGGWRGADGGAAVRGAGQTCTPAITSFGSQNASRRSFGRRRPSPLRIFAISTCASSSSGDQSWFAMSAEVRATARMACTHRYCGRYICACTSSLVASCTATEACCAVGPSRSASFSFSAARCRLICHSIAMAWLRAAPLALSTQSMSTFSARIASSSSLILDGTSAGMIRHMHGAVASASSTSLTGIVLFGSSGSGLSASLM